MEEEVLEGFGFAGVEVQLVEDGVVQVADSGVREQLEGGGERSRKSEGVVTSAHGSYINNQTSQHLKLSFFSPLHTAAASLPYILELHPNQQEIQI